MSAPATPRAPGPERPDRGLRGALVLLALAVSVLLAAVAVEVAPVIWRAAHRSQMPTFTAWESRVTTEAIIAETAEELGLPTAPGSYAVEPAQSCWLPDGSYGKEFHLRGLEHFPEGELYPVKQRDAWAREVERYWASLGEETKDFSRSELRILVVTLPDGAGIVFQAGPGGFALYGFSGCGITEGTDPRPATSVPSATSPTPTP